jgi:BlaI family penicillinase repressor
MNRLPRISEAEWEVMQVVWDGAPIGASEIVEQLAPVSGWNHRTIRSMLNRLVNKGALAYREQGNRYLYRAKVKRESYVREQSRSFVDKIFSGDAGSMLVHFVENGNLSEDDLARLRTVLNQHVSKRGK